MMLSSATQAFWIETVTWEQRSQLYNNTLQFLKIKIKSLTEN